MKTLRGDLHTINRKLITMLCHIHLKDLEPGQIDQKTLDAAGTLLDTLTRLLDVCQYNANALIPGAAPSPLDPRD